MSEYRPSLEHTWLTCQHPKGENYLINYMATHSDTRMYPLGCFHMLISDLNILSSKRLAISSKWKVMYFYGIAMIFACKSFMFQTIWCFFFPSFSMTSSTMLIWEILFYQLLVLESSETASDKFFATPGKASPGISIYRRKKSCSPNWW